MPMWPDYCFWILCWIDAGLSDTESVSVYLASSVTCVQCFLSVELDFVNVKFVY